MPGPVSLPHTWRPYGARIVGTVLGAMLLALVVAVWIAWGADVRSSFTLFQRSTIGVMGLACFAVWYALMRSRVTVDTDGVVVVNGYRRRTFEWSQVIAINLRRGAPWAGLDLSDGTSISLLAIQGSDGQRAVQAVQDLRRLVEENSRTERDD